MVVHSLRRTGPPFLLLLVPLLLPLLLLLLVGPASSAAVLFADAADAAASAGSTSTPPPETPPPAVAVDPLPTLERIDRLAAEGNTHEASRLATALVLTLIAGDVHKITPAHLDAVARALDTGQVDMGALAVTVPASGGDNLLHVAVRRDDLHLVRMLLLARLPADARSDDGLLTALHLAVDYGSSARMVWALLKEGGANPLVTDRHGRTPLHAAVLRSPPRVVQMLLEAAPEALAVRDLNGDTPLDLALLAPVSVPIVKLLAEASPGVGAARRAQQAVAQRGQLTRSGADRLPGSGKWIASKKRASRKASLRCDFDIVDVGDIGNGNGNGDEAALQSFLSGHYSRARPVILRGAGLVVDWPGRRLLTRKNMLEGLGHLRARSSRVPYSDGPDTKMRTVKEFVTKCMRGSQARRVSRGCTPSEILFDRVRAREFLETFRIPPQARACLGTYPRPSSLHWPQIIMSGATGGAPFHDHQHALNGLVYGAKEWMLVPPGFSHLAHEIANTNGTSESGAWERAKARLDAAGVLSTCTQVAGDLLFVPRMWMHATRSLEESVAIALEFCSAVGSQEFAHRERIAAELYGSDSVVDALTTTTEGVYSANAEVAPVGAGTRDFFSHGGSGEL